MVKQISETQWIQYVRIGNTFEKQKCFSCGNNRTPVVLFAWKGEMSVFCFDGDLKAKYHLYLCHECFKIFEVKEALGVPYPYNPFHLIKHESKT